MNTLSVCLTLLSSVLHAWWNFLLKRAKGGDTFIGLTKISEMVLFAVPFFVIEHREGAAIAQRWPLFTVGAMLTLLNYLFLGRAYRQGDLSVAYPISRAGALVFLPVLSWAFLGQRPSRVGVLALVLIIVGTFLIQLTSFSRLRETLRAIGHRSNTYAVLAACMVACYSLWDQHSVQRMTPSSYFFSYTIVMGLCYGAKLVLCPGIRTLVAEWRKDWPSILQVASFNTVGYLAVLLALQSGTATYVIALRQLSIVLGSVLGWWLLAEVASVPKRLGLVVLASGCLLVTAAG